MSGSWNGRGGGVGWLIIQLLQKIAFWNIGEGGNLPKSIVSILVKLADQLFVCRKTHALIEHAWSLHKNKLTANPIKIDLKNIFVQIEDKSYSNWRTENQEKEHQKTAEKNSSQSSKQRKQVYWTTLLKVILQNKVITSTCQVCFQ